MQLGNSSGTISTGYVGSTANITYASGAQNLTHSTGIPLTSASITMSYMLSGEIAFTYHTAGYWIYSGKVEGISGNSLGAAYSVGGRVVASSTVDRIVFTHSITSNNNLTGHVVVTQDYA